MAKKNDVDQYLVQAYQSPYNNELYPFDKKEEFEKHLRQEARLARERDEARTATDARKNLWKALRESAQSMEDVTRLLSELPPELATYYRKRAFFKSAGDAGWTITLRNTPKLGMQSISHESPLSEGTNWCSKDKQRPGNLVGLSGDANENLNYLFSEAKRESGLQTCNGRYTLFADDWPFVAKQVLLATFDKTFQFPEKYERSNGKFTEEIRSDHTRFWGDVDRYSRAYTGMPYSELQGMRDSLGLSKEDLVTMMASYALNKHSVGHHEAIVLPENMGADCMQSPA